MPPTDVAEPVSFLPDLQARIQAYYPDFFASYRTLYPTAGQERIDALLKQVQEAYEQRPNALRERDQLRVQHPNWFTENGLIGMMLYVDLFSGDLQGLAERLDYLEELGITYLHLMPLLKSREGANDGGYAVADYKQVDPRLGSMKDLRQLADKLRDRGMVLVIDFVMNHTAKEHEWAQRAMAGEAYYQNFYRMFPDRRQPDAYEKTLPEVFPDFAPGNFTWEEQPQKWVWTTFNTYQWDLNYENPDVFEAMLGEIFFLANQGVDVLRLDAVPFLWKKMGTNSQNQPEVVHLLAAFKALVRMAAPGVLFKSEAIVAPEEIIKYLGSGGFEGKACEMGYNATLMNHLWHALACENTQLLYTTLSGLPHLPETATWLNYIRCHDDIGWGISDENAAAVHQNGRNTRNFCTDFYAGILPHSYAEGYAFQRDRHTGEARISGTAAALSGLQKAQIEADADKINAAIHRIRLLNGVIFFMKGIPLLYSGDEIGQLNDFTYLTDPLKASDNRWIHRPPMNWTKAGLRKRQGTVESRLFHLHRSIIEARKSLAIINGHTPESLVFAQNDALFLCERHDHKNSPCLLVANFSQSTQILPLNRLSEIWRDGTCTDVLTRTAFHFGAGHLVIGPYDVYWLQPESNFEAVDYVKMPISVHVETTHGEEVMIAGSNGALGNWELTHAKRCSAQNYPWWHTEISVPVGEAFCFRWVRVKDNQIIQWGPELFHRLAGFVA
ncbi:MAG: hypothetical protein JNN12_10805 [Bacteroidetes Order II. Incertae sedis bacterium]|nr:hypothetical protein [Bacteroidetes Order II. bacterium]